MNDFVVLNGNEQELWEIDYEKKVAFNISELKIVENENKMTNMLGPLKITGEEKASPKSSTRNRITNAYLWINGNVGTLINHKIRL
jgi:hypothetical protein